MPRLWSFLSLDFDRMLPKGAYLDLCEIWLARAQSTPLSISLASILNHDVDHPLLKFIGALSQQWEDIELLRFRGDLRRRLSLPVDGYYPLLEKLSIATSQSGPISFCDAPKLREVVLSTYTTQIQLPWHQLATLRTGDIDVPHFLGILRDASNLANGNFSIGVCYPSALPPTVVPLDNLQSLTLDFQRTTRTMAPLAVLNCLKTPSLKSVTLVFPHFVSTDNYDVSPYLSFISRSSFQLHTLALSLMPAATGTLIECLKATPSLVHLKLLPLRLVVNTMFAQLRGHSDFLPKLESLHFIFSHSRISGVKPGVAAAILVDMLCWRWASVGITRLQSFRLAYAASSDPAVADAVTVHPKFRRLKDEGMMLYIGRITPGLDSFPENFKSTRV
jgi:hypothetical protein